MADLHGMDPARIERLRSPDRLEHFDPALIWQTLGFEGKGTVLDIGCGVGFVTLPLAAAFPEARVVGCDILEGMVALLGDDASERGLTNLSVVQMEPGSIPLPDGTADLITMAQVHHEVDEPLALLEECRRLLSNSGTLAIVDWKDEENGRSPPAGRRVPERVIRDQLAAAGFTAVQSHPVYTYHAFLSAGVGPR